MPAARCTYKSAHCRPEKRAVSASRRFETINRSSFVGTLLPWALFMSNSPEETGRLLSRVFETRACHACVRARIQHTSLIYIGRMPVGASNSAHFANLSSALRFLTIFWSLWAKSPLREYGKCESGHEKRTTRETSHPRIPASPPFPFFRYITASRDVPAGSFPAPRALNEPGANSKVKCDRL